MKIVELYLRVRQSVFVEGRSRRETARLFGIARKTVDKMCAFSAPPGYRRRSPAAKPKLDGFTGIIDQILADDQRMPAKQQHTAKRIFERLRDEYGFAGHYTIVKSYIHDRQVSAKEMFVPLHHPAGHAQVDFGEGLIGGVARKLHFFCMDLGRDLRQSIPGGDNRGFSGRACVRFLWKAAALDPLRQHGAGGGCDLGRWAAQADKSLHRVAVALPV
jgi:transposase